jgi:hypothetical protein
LSRALNVLDDAAVLRQIVWNVLDRVPVAVQRIGLVDLLVVEPVVDDLSPARRLSSRVRRADAERKRSECGE